MSVYILIRLSGLIYIIQRGAFMFDIISRSCWEMWLRGEVRLSSTVTLWFLDYPRSYYSKFLLSDVSETDDVE